MNKHHTENKYTLHLGKGNLESAMKGSFTCKECEQNWEGKNRHWLHLAVRCWNILLKQKLKKMFTHEEEVTDQWSNLPSDDIHNL
jgi:hypothetical protein